MGKVAENWLVEVDRQALPSYLNGLAGTGVSVSDEVGEAFRRLTFPNAVADSVVTSSGLTRFALAIEWEGDEGGFREAYATKPRKVTALRRHDRFAAARLGGGDDQRVDVAVAEGKVLAGRAVDSLPERTVTPGLHPSRAGAKLAEAFAYLQTRGMNPDSWGHWLELGAFPGGMTTELSRRGLEVTALDVAAPTAQMLALAGVHCVTSPAELYLPTRPFDAILCDVNGQPGKTAATVAELARALRPGGLLIHTLKLPSWHSLEELVPSVKARFRAAGLESFATKHLRQNRQELTLFAVKEPNGHLRHR